MFVLKIIVTQMVHLVTFLFFIIVIILVIICALSSSSSSPCFCIIVESCTGNEEWDALCHYLSVPKCLTDLLQWDVDSNVITSSVITLAAKRYT